MALTPADAAELLTLAATFDDRIDVTESRATAWADALHDLDPQVCALAIRSHYQDSEWPVMPAQIRQRVSAIRATETERERANRLRNELAIEAAEHDPKASRRGYLAARAVLNEALGIDDTRQAELEAQRGALAVRCPFCHAAAGSECRNVDRPSRRPHPSRMDLAAKGAAA